METIYPSWTEEPGGLQSMGLFIGEHNTGEQEGGLEEMKQEVRPQCQEALLSWPPP